MSHDGNATNDVPISRKAAYRAAGWWRPELLDDLVLSGHQRSAPALTEGSRSVSRGELADTATACASGLRRLGVGAGDTAIVQLPNEIGMLVLVLGLLRVGALPVLTLPALREHELDPVLAALRPTIMAVPRRQRRFDHLAMARGLRQRHACVRNLVVSGGGDLPDEVDLEALWAEPARSPATRRRSPSDVALHLLSSGTTGAPKPIPRTHEAFGHVIRHAAEVSCLDESSVYLAALPATHSFAFGHPGVLGTLASGGRVVLAGPDDPAAALRLVATEGVTHCALAPAVLLRWLQAAERDEYDTSSLRVLQVGGSRLSETTAERAHALLGGRVQQVYGMSEGLLNFTRLDDPAEMIVGTQGRPSSPADETLVVDERGESVPTGETGELLARGPGVIAGYHAGASAASFTADGFYRTGDLVKMDPAGNFIVMGRVKDVINRGGEKIPADELEALVVRHPSIRSAAAVAMPHAVLGEAVCLYAVSATDDGGVDLRALRMFLEQHGLARFKLPERLVEIDALPLTGVGKVDKVALRADIADRLAQEELSPKRQTTPSP
ncbi:(2,3-dihydroxybenzoyl)adenylate synthase [Saccharopolyspora gloriosae]|uniref:(2,3-dihydroxybenzoyl)adenylate synthase n=1 Tax=Saccharopolyspora gloriosae TaxID=455344 RepID=UPI001FB791AD|nr:AMP-binding protein [Saccharopolyspora gloriosae]